MNSQVFFNAVWYGGHPLGILLLPLSWLFRLVVALRRAAYATGLVTMQYLPVPVVVVGNITVGGTGKTPLVIWLSRFLRARGYSPGIITRGYGGKATHWPRHVHQDSDPFVVGDEPVLLARRSGCPVVAAPQRVAAARLLVEQHRCDIIVADDGLQHLILGRDVEIAVVDGDRRFGNARCLPAGPLREPVSRLDEVDLIVASGGARENEFGMGYTGDTLYNLADESRQRRVGDFGGAQVHAVAGVGHPARFFSRLRSLGLRVIEHPFPDHHVYIKADLDFGDNLPVVMTEKDAVKCLPMGKAQHWYLPITADLRPRFGDRLLSILRRKQHG